MIPKKLHYCWLGGGAKPDKIKKCMDSWQRVMPEYELVCWDKKRFDINSNVFVAEACQVKKWAFAADYIRLHALYTAGGIYLDTDVLVRKKFDEFLKYDFFSAVEYHPPVIAAENSTQYLNPDGTSRKKGTCVPGIGIQAAIFGGVPGHPFLKDCLDYYRDRHFILENGEHDNKLLAPGIYAMTAEKHGFRYKDEQQELGNKMMILPSKFFAGVFEAATEETYAIHCCLGSWRDWPKEPFLKRLWRKGKTILRGS